MPVAASSSSPSPESSSNSARRKRKSKGLKTVLDWFKGHRWKPFPFQQDVWEAVGSGKNGLLNAPTGSGKTFALFFPVVIDWINTHKNYKEKDGNGLLLLWITPLRALAKDLEKNLSIVCRELELPWRVESRIGDTSKTVKDRQRRKMPEVLITTPESIHILFAQKDYQRHFRSLKCIVADEWHELMGSKRGVQTELAMRRVREFKPGVTMWGISATIGNMDQALDVLLGSEGRKNTVTIKAEIDKKIVIKTVLPKEIERFPWSGHIGLRLLPDIVPIIRRSRSTLIFTNTRSQCEIWYQNLIERYPEFMGRIAIHHGSIDPHIRGWVEDALADGKLKAVVTTSSLDLGVDFRPVETVIQVGSPKGVSRFMQRAGRSGHRPGEVSEMHFVPTNAIEIIESIAIQESIKKGIFERRVPFQHPLDVLVQYMVTLAVSDGFHEKQLFNEIRKTWAYRGVDRESWEWTLNFLTSGGKALRRYDEYSKVEVDEDGLFKVTKRRTASRHRLSIGTITSDAHMRVKFMSGGSLGSVEESFISQLNPGDVFWFSGRNLEFVKIKDLTAFVRPAKSSKGKVPRWGGGRMSLSSNLSEMLRQTIDAIKSDSGRLSVGEPEIETIRPLMDLQSEWSMIPGENQLLIEYVKTREGHHMFFYPFEGRQVHEGLGALFAFRMSKLKPITFSIAMNDYGFELLSDSEIPIEEAIEAGLFSTDELQNDIAASVNATERAKGRFREISRVAGLVFQGYPGNMKANRHLQSSSSLLFEVFEKYEPENMLVQQAYDEVLYWQVESDRIFGVMERLATMDVVIKRPPKFTPFGFQIMTDRLREKLSSEKLTHRIQKMLAQLEKQADR